MTIATSTTPITTREQVRQRRERMAALLAERGLDALVVDSPAAVAYLSDVDIRPFARRSTAVVLREDGGIVFVASDADAISLDIAGYDGERELWTTASEKTSFLAKLSNAVRRSSGAVRVGVERAGLLPTGDFGLFGLSYPPGKVVPAGDLVADAMRIKDDEELERLRAAGVLAEIAYTATVDRMHPELRAYEIVRNVDRSVRGAGGAGWWSLDERGDTAETACFPQGAIVGLLDRRPETGVLDRSAPLPFQVHPLSQCYTGGAATTIVLQEPSAQVRARADRLARGVAAAVATAAPGVTGDAVHRAFIAASEGVGSLVGFSAGTGPGETLVVADADDELQSRMAITLRAFARGEPGAPGVVFQTTVLIVDEGAERLDAVVPLRLIELY